MSGRRTGWLVVIVIAAATYGAIAWALGVIG